MVRRRHDLEQRVEDAGNLAAQAQRQEPETDAEFRAVQRHPVLGAKKLGNHPQLVEAVAVIGSPAESWMVTEVSQARPESTEECIAQGLLVVQGDGLAFRHELARVAVLGEISPPRQIELHRRVLAALRTEDTSDFARLAHHAAAAFDREAVLIFGVAAAKRAAALGCEGKWAIHPTQIELASQVFTPPEREIEKAKRIIAALKEAASQGKGAAALDGRLIDAASERMANNVMKIAEAIAAKH